MAKGEGLKLVSYMSCSERKLKNLTGEEWKKQYSKCVDCQTAILVRINKCNGEK